MSYVDGILKTILGDALTENVYTVQPATLLTLMPCVIAHHVGGPGAVDARFSSTRATVQIDGYHATKRGAYDLTRVACDVLVEAWLHRVSTPDGFIANVISQSDPAELRLPDQADGFTRYTATFMLTCRSAS